MPQAPLTDALARGALDAVRLHGGVSQAAKAIGVARPTLQGRLRVARARGLLLADEGGDFEVKARSETRDASGALLRESVRTGRAPTPREAVPEGHVVRGLSSYLDAQGRITGQWIKTAAAPASADAVAAMREAFEAYRGRAELAPPPADCDADLLSVYVVTDVHAGMLAHAPESGADYDTGIAADRLRSCLSALIGQAPRSAEALILNLGDFFHANGPEAETPANKHRLDVDSRFYKTVRTGIRVFIDCIDLALQRHDRVRVRCIPGNHDPEACLALTVALSAFYHAEPRVTVDEDPSDFFFALFGSTLIGACHGHKLPPERMAMAMASLRPEEWGRSRYRWFLHGHIHRERTVEVGSVRCEAFQALASRDAYAAGCGFTSGSSMTSVTLHRERGEIGRHRVNVGVP